MSLLPPLGPLYGSFYFGTVLSTAFYGITCMQTFFYFVHYPRDSLSTKIFVAVLLAFNTIHEALTIAGTYKYLMLGLVNQLSFLMGIPELVTQLIFSCLVAIPSQGYLVYRIYIFSSNNLLAPLIWVPLAISQIVTAFYYVIKALYRVDGVIKAVPINILNGKPFTTVGSLFLSVAAAADVLIAVSMTILLVRSHSSTEFGRTAHLLQRLIFFSVNTGIWTAAFALSTLILLHVFPDNVLYAVPGVAICPVYCNTLLANLNARTYIRNGEAGGSMKMEIFSDPSSQATETARMNDKRHAESGLIRSQGVWKTTEVVKFSELDQSRPSVKDCEV